MAPGGELPSLFVTTMLTRQLGDKRWWDVLANCVENGESTSKLGSMRFLFHYKSACSRLAPEIPAYLFS